jgi:hypothetical protein
MCRRLIASFLSIFLLSVFSISCSTKNHYPADNKSPIPAITNEIVQPDRVEANLLDNKNRQITITGVGDIMLGTNFPTDEYLPPDDGAGLLTDLTSYLKQSDITFGNLEGSLLTEGKCIKACSDPKKCYAFRMPEHYVSHLSNAGFNLLSIANNHIGDFGIEGREKTIEVLNNAKIHFAGTLTQPYTTFTKDGIKYGFCAFAPNAGTPDIREIDEASETVKYLDSISDIVIVSFHGGAEGGENRYVTREAEMFYGEDRGNVFEFAHSMIDSGADVIFGHGPHVTRAIELYNDRFIAYSLGNFCTYARFNLLDHNGIAPLIKIHVDKSGKFLDGKIIPLIQEYKKGPAVDDQSWAISDIFELTCADFPETDLIIQKDGLIRKKY